MKNTIMFFIIATLALIALTGCNLVFAPAAPAPAQPPAPSVPGQPPGQSPAEQPGQPPGQQPGQPPSEGVPGEQQVTFTADRFNLNPGECATLTWNVQVQGNAWVELDAQRVDRSGQKQVCPPETRPFILHVDLGTSVVRREVLIVVGGAGQPPPGQPPGQPPQPPPGQPPGQPPQPPPGQPPGQPPQPPPGQPPAQPTPGQPPAGPTQPGCPGAPVIPSFTANPSTISAGQSSTLSWGNVTNGNTTQLVKSVTITPGLGEVGSGASSRQVKPTTTTTYTLTATGCGGTATRQVTVTVTAGSGPAPTATLPLLQVVLPDLAVTNVYAKQAESWRLKFTIKNTGQGDLTNVGGSFSCSMSWIPTGSKTGKAQNVNGFLNVTLKVGQETTLDGGLTLSDVAYYDATCSISPNILDTNSGNNSKSVKITRGP